MTKNRPIHVCCKLFGILFSNLLLTTQTLALATTAGPGTGTGQQLDQSAAGTVAVTASLDNSIRAVDTMMTEQGADLLTDLKWLKWMGYLCRRTKTDVEREIAKAQANMAELQHMRRSRYLDAARARMIAYALGMEADTLANQARTLAEILSPTEKAVSVEGEDAFRRQQLAVQTLSTMSSVLHELAKAIIENLDKRRTDTYLPRR